MSLVKDADNLPGARTPINTIVSRFKDAGFTPEETVILSGDSLLGLKFRSSIFKDQGMQIK